MGVNKFRLDGLCAVVTGGSKGLGKAMAQALAAAGADVVVTSRNADEVKKAAVEISAAGRPALGLAANVADRASVAGLVGRAEAEFGKVDILVNNAGTGAIKPTLAITDADWDAVLATNLKGALLCAQAVVPGMAQRHFGRIINVGSILSRLGQLGLASYAASKHGLLGLTRSMALEWATSGITVNCLCPGFFSTAMTRSLVDDAAAYQSVIDRTPLRRWGQPDDLDGPIVFLASSASSFVTGTALYVDGGWTAQ